MEIIERIKELASKNKLTGVQVGEILGLSKSPLTDWKNGKAKPTLEQIIILANQFNVSTDYLLKGKEHGLTLLKNDTVNKGEVRKMGKRFVNTELVINSLHDCLGHLYKHGSFNYSLAPDTSSLLDRDLLSKYAEYTEIPIERLNEFLDLVFRKSTAEELYPTKYELKSMMLASEAYTTNTETLYSRLKDEEEHLKERTSLLNTSIGNPTSNKTGIGK